MLNLPGMLGPLFQFQFLSKVVILMSKRLFAGIDVSLENNQLCLMDYDGNTVGKSLSFANNLTGALAMVEYLNSLMDAGDFEKLIIGMEATALYRFPLFLADQVHMLIKQTLQQLELLEKHIARLDKKIAKKMRKFSTVLESIPGIGPVLAAGILAEIGDISRFPSQAQLAKYAGLTWRKNQSGNFIGNVTPLTKTGNSYLRYYLIQAAQCMVNHNAEYRDYFNRKFKETARHPYKRALSLTARKLVRLVYALLSRNQLYMAPEIREHRKLVHKEVSRTSVPKVQSENSQTSQKPKETVTKKVKTLTVAARPKRTLPRQQEHARGRAVNT
jgi:hypothetical protein